MGYTSQENYRRIRQEYETKYLRAQEAADARLAEVHAAIPALVELDKKLGGLGIESKRAWLLCARRTKPCRNAAGSC